MRYKSRKLTETDASREARGLKRQIASLLKEYEAGVPWIHPGMRIMDYGSGSGELAVVYAHATGPAGSVIGVDICKPLLAVCQRRYRSIPNLSFLHVPEHGLLPAIQAGKLKEGEFDVIQARWAFHHIREEEHVERLRELMRLLKPGGMIRLEELDRRDFRVSPDFPGWTTIQVEVHRAHIRNAGAPFVGWNVGHLLRQAGLTQVNETHTPTEGPVTAKLYQRFLSSLPPKKRAEAERLRKRAVKFWMANGAVSHCAHHIATGIKA